MRPALHGVFLGVATAVAALTAPAVRAADPRAASLRPISPQEWNADAAAHLLRRVAFGGTPEQVAQLAALGPQRAVDSLLSPSATYDPAPPAFDPLVRERPRPMEMAGLSDDERRRRQEQDRVAEREATLATRWWWLERMCDSPRPAEEMLTLFWHGHFTSGMREVKRALFMYEQDVFLRRHALGSFRDLVHGISRDRAMLVYLDGWRSTQRSPNENYARELMELFTLGVGHYTEDDVKAAARAFTGWSFDEDGFVERPRQHDVGPKLFLGQRGPLDGDDVLDVILRQPACAEFLARKLLTNFCRPDPPPELVRSLAGVMRREKYELRPVLRTLLLSEAFYCPEARGALVKSPAVLLVGTARQLGIHVTDMPLMERALAAMGQELMQPPNVKGWDGGSHWITTATLYQRYNALGGLLFGTADRPRPRVLRPTTTAPAEDAPMTGDAMAPTSAAPAFPPQSAFDPLPLVQAAKLETADEIVGYFVQHLLAVPLSADKRQVLVDYLDDGGAWSLTRPDAAARVRMMLDLLLSTPEYQMY